MGVNQNYQIKIIIGEKFRIVFKIKMEYIIYNTGNNVIIAIFYFIFTPKKIK